MGKDDKHIVEGDGSKVPVRLAPVAAKPSEMPRRPDKGSQLIFGGADPQSPWGQIAALIGAGGSVPYTLLDAAVLAKAQRLGKKPGSAEKPKEKKGEKEKEHKPPESPDIIPAHAPEIFAGGEEFKHAGQPARVWAHGETESLKTPRPLLIFLHGVSRPQGKPYPQLQDHLEIKNLVHIGHLAKHLIDDQKVEPLLIAAPTCEKDGSSTTLWTDFDLAGFVEDVRKVVEKHGIKIDDQEVSVAGHSGAGCNSDGGLARIAKAGAKFGSHELKVLGLADTCCLDSGAGKAIGDAMGKLRTRTILYSVHQGGGGAGRDKNDKLLYSGAKAFGNVLGATTQRTFPYPGGEGPEISDYRDDGGTPARRISLKLPAPPDQNVADAKAVYRHKQVWVNNGAVGKKIDLEPHYCMTLNWTWYALQRFYPRVSAAAPKHAEEDSAPHPGKDHDHLAEIGRPGDDWAQVPPGPPPWKKLPEARPRSNPPSTFADPGSGRFWPVRTQSLYGRAVAFIGEDRAGYGGGAATDRTAQRHFLAPRATDTEHWFNGGVDLYADFGDMVVATEQGVIANFDPLWAGVWRLLVHCTSGLVICYGGLDPDSLAHLGLKVGDHVSAGQPIGMVGRATDGHAMLHFETYPTGTPEPVPLWGKSLLDKVHDPTAYLLALAKSGG
jgi:murein DD-endopeptidase MepM/ murein hydrolase activator NlpD